MRFDWSAKEPSLRIQRAAMITALVLIVFDAAICFKAPFSDLWNEILAKVLLLIAASFAAAVAAMVWAR